ncbi:MAG: hypothetical protein ABH967_02380 [Patescibacteria group bacterium]
MKKPWVITVNMGYGHQRTTYSFRKIAEGGKIIPANDYDDIPFADKRLWKSSRDFYEAISRFKRFPILGPIVFSLFDKLQKILSFYPKRDLSKNNFQTTQLFFLIERGWGKHLIEKLRKKPRVFLTSFFTPAFMAEMFGYPEDIFCIICDADIARSWVSKNPQKSKIKYFVPNKRVEERLKLYGIQGKNIFLTGYPLPKENIGTEKMNILKKDIANRLVNLDPEKRYEKHYGPLIKKYIGELPQKSDHPLTITFAVGGAGAQKEIGVQILDSLKKEIKSNKLKFILVAGTRKKVRDYFVQQIKKLRLGVHLGNNIEVLFEEKIEDYFSSFNKTMRQTDILWTKPSELSFYTGLGLPIIMAPSIGSQEDFNREWILKIGSAMPQKDIRYTNEWLFDLLNRGWFAEACMQGFIEAETLGTFNIEKIISK